MNNRIEKANELYKILPEEGKKRVLDFMNALMKAEEESNKKNEKQGYPIR